MTTFNCEICNYETDIKSNYTRHMKSVKHLKLAGAIPQKKVYRCEQDDCTYETTDCSNFRKHQEVHKKRVNMPREDLYGKIAVLRKKVKKLDNKIQVTKDDETKGYLKDLRSMIIKEYNKLTRLSKLDNKPIEVKKPVEKKQKPVEVVEETSSPSKEKTIEKINNYVKNFTDLGLDPSDQFDIRDDLYKCSEEFVNELLVNVEQMWYDKEEMDLWIEENKQKI